ncbi:MAG TPA: hypothetical protein VH916_10995, partial [Dehalococcoidia bacterium]
ITNGDSAAGTIALTGIGGTVLSWRDLLYEGPVPGGLDAGVLRVVRARYIAERGWATVAEALADLSARDAMLAAGATHDETVLWFEHDLHDQFQLIQILAALAALPDRSGRLHLICIGAYPGIEDFRGLGQLDAAQLASLFPERRPVTAAQIELAVRAWRAFRSADPRAIEAVLEDGTAALPFLGAALRRHLEQFPAAEDGLGRSERQILAGAARGAATPLALFAANSSGEEAPFLGDTSFFELIAGLAAGAVPLLAASDGGALLPPGRPEAGEQFRRQQLTATEAGRSVLAGTADLVRLNGIDRWLGGVHLHGARSAWRWNRSEGRLVAGG